ncbi:MAG: hypothetical protein NC416_18705, partial [Eubacterium sp.]|nr:hypothetical protein [Eubacterium sp.]
TILRSNILKEMNYLKYALCILNASTDHLDDAMYVKQKLNLPLYISIEKENAHYLRRFSFKSTLTKLKESSLEVKNRINNSNCLLDLDPYIATLLTNLPIESIFSVLEQVASSIDNNYPFKFTDKGIISLQKQLNQLECLPGMLSPCICTVNENKNLHSKYDNELLYSQQDEYMYTINIDNESAL